MNRVNIGCGNKYLDGWVNVDQLPQVQADIYCDLNQFPWPLPSGEYDVVWMDNVIEHLQDLPKVAREVHRILKPGGTWSGSTPYCFSGSSYRDPTHLHHLDPQALEYFTWGWAPWAGGKMFEKKFIRLHGCGNGPLTHKIRNWLFPWFLRPLLKHVLLNMYESIEWELVKI